MGRTISFKTLLSASKGVAPCKAVSALRSFFRSACSVSQFHCKGGRGEAGGALFLNESIGRTVRTNHLLDGYTIQMLCFFLALGHKQPPGKGWASPRN